MAPEERGLGEIGRLLDAAARRLEDISKGCVTKEVWEMAYGGIEVDLRELKEGQAEVQRRIDEVAKDAHVQEKLRNAQFKTTIIGIGMLFAGGLVSIAVQLITNTVK